MAQSEAGWEQFRADIKKSKVVVNTKQEKPRLQFHIPILAQAPKYRPGSGPPPPEINLRPVHDDSDTAFIVDKVILPRGPFPPNDTIRQRRCYYIVGWPDLPAARTVVDATKVLEYVSPRTLEDWEYQDALRREEERERAEEAEKAGQRALAKGKAVATMPAGAAAAAATTQPGARRRPGRAPRSRMMVADTPPEPVLNSEEEEELVHKRMKGPSLSTPQKSRIAQLQAEEEMLEGLEEVGEDDTAEITGPLGGLGEGEGEDTSDGGVNKRVVGVLDELRLSSAVPGTPSGGESSRASSTRPARGNQASTLATAPAHAVQSKFPMSTTPIPLPSAFSRMKKWTPKAQATSRTSTTVSRPNAAGGQGSAPPTLPHSDPIHGGQSSHADLPSHTNGFTPIGRTFPRPPKRPSDESPPSGDASAKRKQKKSRRNKKQADLPLGDAGTPGETAGSHDPAQDVAQDEQEYVVKRLEGDQVQDGVHYFKVRWEGDWPDDQNPTWEPRENITEKLVVQYLERKARREEGRHAKAGAKKRSKMKQANPLADQARALGSVLEVFEGPANLDGAGDMDADQGGAQGGGSDAAMDSPDELLVTDEAKELAAIERRRAMQDEFAAQLAGLARSAPRHF